MYIVPYIVTCYILAAYYIIDTPFYINDMTYVFHAVVYVLIPICPETAIFTQTYEKDECI